MQAAVSARLAGRAGFLPGTLEAWSSERAQFEARATIVTMTWGGLRFTARIAGCVVGLPEGEETNE
jgi:hypothetical protein